jgi:hypothetical protein
VIEPPALPCEFLLPEAGRAQEAEARPLVTAAEAEAMQRWIAESGIETRPAPEPYRGPMLGVAGGTKP